MGFNSEFKGLKREARKRERDREDVIRRQTKLGLLRIKAILLEVTDGQTDRFD